MCNPEINRTYTSFMGTIKSIHEIIHEKSLNLEENISGYRFSSFINSLITLKTDTLAAAEIFEKQLINLEKQYYDKEKIRDYYCSNIKQDYLKLLIKTKVYFQKLTLNKIILLNSWELELILLDKKVEANLWFLLNGPDNKYLDKYIEILKAKKLLNYMDDKNEAKTDHGEYLANIISIYTQTANYVTESEDKPIKNISIDRILHLTRVTLNFVELYRKTYNVEHSDVDNLTLEQISEMLVEMKIPIKDNFNNSKVNDSDHLSIYKDSYLAELHLRNPEIIGWDNVEGYYYFNNLPFEDIHIYITRLIYEIYITAVKNDFGLLITNSEDIVTLNSKEYLYAMQRIHSNKLTMALSKSQKKELIELNKLVLNIFITNL